MKEYLIADCDPKGKAVRRQGRVRNPRIVNIRNIILDSIAHEPKSVLAIAKETLTPMGTVRRNLSEMYEDYKIRKVGGQAHMRYLKI